MGPLTLSYRHLHTQSVVGKAKARTARPCIGCGLAQAGIAPTQATLHKHKEIAHAAFVRYLD